MLVSGDPQGIADVQRVAVDAAAAVMDIPPQGIGGDVGEAGLAAVLLIVVESYADAAVRLAAEAEQVGVYAVGVADGLARADAVLGP